MKALFKFIGRFHFFLLFLILETIAFSIIINNNIDKKAKLISSANFISGYFYSRLSIIDEYLSLREINKDLQAENARLLNKYKHAYRKNFVSAFLVDDSIYQQQYVYIPARIVNNSVHRKQNYLTLNKGENDGVKIDMGVVGQNGIIGIVRDVSNNYASAISVLNTKIGISAKIKRNGFFGSIIWDGRNYRTVNLREIPNHVQIERGDTIITSGFSTIFPEGILVGTIESFQHGEGENFYDIRVRLAEDFKKVHYVNVIGNLMRKEQQELESGIMKTE
jgi:rod shape-determining protein MreC